MRSEERNPERTVGNPEAMAKVLVNALTGDVGTRSKISGNPTNQALTSLLYLGRRDGLDFWGFRRPGPE